ncbi:MAG TPA: DUF3455 domain-containing protein [Acidobacteriaceae bacterium]|jgi:hypothetical protein|nr:DUF3455 domain-containing protein [Acidobacteriaceae bacterium]
MRFVLSIFLAATVAIPSLSAQQGAGSVEPPAGARVVLQAKGEGVQVYGCASGANGFAWALQGPDARLLDAVGKQIGTHFAGPTWKLNDGGQVQGALIASEASPDAGSVAWLLLRAKAGTATGSMAEIAFIRRTETHGGVASKTQCATASDAGKTVRVPYTATYTFYAAQ